MPTSTRTRFNSSALFKRAGRPWLVLLALGGPMLAGAATEPTEESAPDAGPGAGGLDAQSCLACHASLTKTASTHAITKSTGCLDCHVQEGMPERCKVPTGVGWKLKQDPPKLCLGCHKLQSKTPFHAPIQGMGCKSCHEIHGSENKKLLKKWPATQLCYRCHDRMDEKKVVHTAVKSGLCLGCHNPHSGEAAPLLKKKPNELCLSCHDPDSLYEKPVHHTPVGEGRCLDCHDPHGSDFANQLRTEGKPLCMNCHDAEARKGLDRPGPQARIDLKKENVHQPVSMGKCQSCHVQVHSGEVAKLLKKPPPELCYGCHDRQDEGKFTHGAIRLGDCPVCHDPHSSANSALLRDKAPADLCFRCHQNDLSGRNAVHKPVGEGRCLECHGPHGGDQRQNLKKAGKELCQACHKPNDDVKVKHLALERYGCTGCHDPHGSNHPMQLAKPVNKLCTSCHTNMPDARHATAIVRGGHVAEGGGDPRRDGRTFSCASCHNPHGSDNPKLFYLGADGFEMCEGCHGDKSGQHPERKDIHRRNRKFGTDAGVALSTPRDGGPSREERQAAPILVDTPPAAQNLPRLPGGTP